MRRAHGVLASGVALVVAAAVLAGCAEPPRPQPSATALPGGIEASIVQLRSDVADRQAQLRVHNTDDEPLTIGTVRVDDPRFLGHAVRTIRRQTTIAPGATVDIRIQLPSMNCAADGSSDRAAEAGETSPQTALTPAAAPEPDPTASAGAGPSASPRPTPAPGGPPKDTSTRATVGYQFGASIAIAVAQLSEPIPFLASLYERECLGERLADVAAVTIAGFTPSPAGQPADLALQIAPNADASADDETGTDSETTDAGAADAAASGLADDAPRAATIVGIHQTNLLSFGAAAGSSDASYPIGAVVDRASGVQTLHLPLVPGRCDAHVVQEDKRGTVFTLDVELDGEPGTIELAATPVQRGEILAWVSAWCGIG